MTEGREGASKNNRTSSSRPRTFDGDCFQPLVGETFEDEPVALKLGLQESDAGFFRHIPPQLATKFPTPKQSGSKVLDLGCGDGQSKSICESRGFEWVGVDVDSRSCASILADGHALPFDDASFDFVLSTKVLQFSPEPGRLLDEVRRVLRPDGTFVGSVAFLEQFHDTFYHYTALGLQRQLSDAGLETTQISPGWEGLIAQSRMTLFPRLPDLLAMLAVLPLYALHVMWYFAGRVVIGNYAASERYRRYMSAGEFYFVAHPADDALG